MPSPHDELHVVLTQHLDATLVTEDERLARASSLGVSTIILELPTDPSENVAA
jgi:hypothetical protein